MVVDTPDDILALVDQGQAAGATAILMNDSKATRWGVGEENDRWLSRMQTVRAGVAARGMDFGFNTITLGFGSSLLALEPNLVAGSPITDQPLVVRGGQLRPITTAAIENGSFEAFAGDRPTGFGFQDAPGVRTSIDTGVARTGSASLRAWVATNRSTRCTARRARRSLSRHASI